jgi:hypothetical protein
MASDPSIVSRRSDGANLLLGQRATRQAQAKRQPQVLNSANDLRRWPVTASRSSLGHAGNHDIDGSLVLPQERRPAFGQRVELLASLFGQRGIAQFLQHGEGGIDDAGAGAVGAPGEILDRLDNLIAVAWLVRDQLQQDEAQLAVIEQSIAAAGTVAAVPATVAASHAEIVPVVGGTGESVLAATMRVVDMH